MTNINLLIVDDEPMAHKVIESHCDKIEFVTIVGNCYDGMSALNAINSKEIDALLLDIQMPELTGLELVEALQSINGPKVIFTTSFTEYAFESFNYDFVVDYLHKPIKLVRFIKSMERLKNVMELTRSYASLENSSIINDKIDNEIIEHVSIRENNTTYKILLQDIIYIQSWGNYMKIFKKDKSLLLVRKTFKELEAILPNHLFIRIHKSYIVNKNKINALKGNQLFIEDYTLPVSKSYMITVKEKLM